MHIHQSGGPESDEDDMSRIDFLKLRNNNIPRLIQILMYILGVIGTCLLGFSFGCMVYHPVNETEYLNNIQLGDSIAIWKKDHLAEEFKSFKLQVKVKSFSNQREQESLNFVTTDKNFNLTQERGHFEKTFEDNNFEFGVFEFEQFNVPLGNSTEYCMAIYYYDKVHKLIYHTKSYAPVLNQPTCVLKASNHFDQRSRTGILINPWHEIKTECTSCACYDGIIQIIDGKPYCFQYLLLESICIVLGKREDNSIEYLQGCYKNNVYQIYRKAHLHEKTYFDHLVLEVREFRDPYITALTLSKDNTPIHFENANFPVIIKYVFQIGFACILLPVMINLAYKANRSPSSNLKRTRINSIIYLKDK